MTVNQSKKQDKQYQVPMVVTDEVIRDFGIKPEEVTWRRIGNRKCRVVMVDATEEEYRAYMAPIWAEIKREDRDGRCMVKGKNGRLIRCPESNRCEECKHFSEASRERNKPASLSVLMDEGAEPIAEGSFEDDVIYETILEDLISMLSEIKPKYGRIFRLLYDGATQQEMADELGIKQRTVSDDITPAVQTSRTGSTVRSMKLLPGNGTTSTAALLTTTRSTAGLGNESATAMLRRTLCVRCA